MFVVLKEYHTVRVSHVYSTDFQSLFGYRIWNYLLKVQLEIWGINRYLGWVVEWFPNTYLYIAIFKHTSFHYSTR